MSVIRDYAGEQRNFCLLVGQIIDLEEACGKVPFGTLYKRLFSWDFFIRDVQHIVRMALIGGGTDPITARRLVDERFDVLPIEQHVSIAIEVMLAAVEGAPEPKSSKKSTESVIDTGKIFHDFAKLGIPPAQVREMRVGDMLVLYDAAGRTAMDDAPSDEEFAAMRARVEGGALDWSLQPTDHSQKEA